MRMYAGFGVAMTAAHLLSISCMSKNPTPKGPALGTPIRGYFALPPEGARMSCPRVNVKIGLAAQPFALWPPDI